MRAGTGAALLRAMTNNSNADKICVPYGETDYLVDDAGNVRMLRSEYSARLNDYTDKPTLSDAELDEVRALAAAER